MDWVAAKSQKEAVAVIAFHLSAAFESVVWNDITSKPLDLQYGVGSILGPLLFLVMVADLPGYVTNILKTVSLQI